MRRNENLDAFLAALPKVENHLHLDGALSPATVKALAEAVPGSLLPLMEILPVQMLSLALATLAGREPGRFERATKVTTVA